MGGLIKIPALQAHAKGGEGGKKRTKFQEDARGKVQRILALRPSYQDLLCAFPELRETFAEWPVIPDDCIHQLPTNPLPGLGTGRVAEVPRRLGVTHVREDRGEKKVTEYAYIICFIGQRGLKGRWNPVKDVLQNPALHIRSRGAEYIPDMFGFCLQIHYWRTKGEKG